MVSSAAWRRLTTTKANSRGLKADDDRRAAVAVARMKVKGAEDVAGPNMRQ